MGSRIAFLGGLYSNYLALEVAINDARLSGVDAIYCLGDMGAFGPFPDRVFPLLHEHQVICIQGNYDDSIGNQLDDCQCGYTDPRDNYFAQISYDYTLAKTSDENRAFLRELPQSLQLEIDGCRTLLCHGSPRRVNEFLWESTTSTQFLSRIMREHNADVMLATHTGIKWHRKIPEVGEFINVGVLGRPENDGTTRVWYTIVDFESGAPNVEFRPIEYDHHRLAREMQTEGLHDEFVETVLKGWWTTCLEILPSKERLVGCF